MQVVSAESTELFVGPPDAPLQLVRVRIVECTEPTSIRVDGAGLSGQALAAVGAEILEVPVVLEDPVVGQRRDARVWAGSAGAACTFTFAFTVAEPGWTMFMVSHFHYDPVWWNTQGAYTSQWHEDPPGRARQTNGFELVHAHLEMARRDPDYKFVLAEVDYLKPYWDTHPQDRADLRRFLAQGRVEVMGGTYNEPNTNLTSPETTIRNLVHGIGFQRDVLGADPATAWQLDVFGHDPQFPGMAADAGLTSSSWARGPHHQWGPAQGGRGEGVERMQFCSEFEWISPSGRGLLTHYMPAHYSAGWWMDSSSSLAEAAAATYALFDELKRVALTRNVLLPVGTDYTPPNKWVSEIHRDWAARYTWPRFVCGLPREFFAAVRAELADRGAVASPQTRDMNPIYTGKDVSYIDTKQANRAAENAVLQAERFAVFAGVLCGAPYPQAALAKAWVQLAYGAHHDAITGSESDQVYLDLLTGWRDAWEIGRTVRDNSLQLLSRAVAGPGEAVVVWNPSTRRRTDIVTIELQRPLGAGVAVRGPDGAHTPAHVDADGRTVSWLASDVPSLGWKTYQLIPTDAATGWEPVTGTEIANEHYRLRVDPERGGGVESLVRDHRQLIADGRVGNELAVYQEYPSHPTQGEGPWHLLPNGPVVCSSESADEVRGYRCPIGQRLVVRGRIGTLLRYTQTLTLWRGVARVDCRTTIDDFSGNDQLVRLRWPCPVPGAMAVSEVGDAVVGRGFALLHPVGESGARSVDTAQHLWTLDNPAYGWFGLFSAVRVRAGSDAVRAVSVAEVVSPSEATSGPLARELMVALVRAGVTATCSGADKPRYGNLDVDSNLPDVRIALGGPARNVFTKAVLADADPGYTAELERQLASGGRARVWVPAATSLASVWVPGADLRAPRALPVLVIDGRDDTDLAAAIAALVDDLADAEISVRQQAPADMEPFEARTIALFNRGMPSFAVDSEGTLHTALMRSCTGWPSRVWIDEPRRTAPDGSNFQLQHWTHDFNYALVCADGDWRRADIPARSAEFSQPLLAVTARDRAGKLAQVGSLLEIEPAGSVQLGALKAAGNPLTAGSARSVDPAAVTLRLVETTGAAAPVTLRCELGELSELRMADLLEHPQRATPGVNLHGFHVATTLARLEMPAVLSCSDALAPQHEAAQPLYARYWLHNRGPAPLGGLPAVAYLHPEQVTAEPGSQVTLRLTTASDCTDSSLCGLIEVRFPDGWSVAPRRLPFDLGAGEYVETNVMVRIPATAGPGLYPVRAQLSITEPEVPAAWRQMVEDVCVVAVGTDLSQLVYLAEEPAELELAAGSSARLAVTVGSRAQTDLTLEAHLISPWGTWEWMAAAAAGAVLPACGSAELVFDVAPPGWLAPGQWWALVRVGCAGRLVYSPAVRVTVT
ncbi:NEW3 domain-containing protein [Mycobacterium ulcerans]|uniref:glycoside hydrolase family 38 N-terminal domain-containing protein n=1 Tax=Mycobacterium ulcerans TaxID=1809 RepID=UPI0012DC3DD7|nr:NEW3 domain-containing protein [Mycobacterium ulcerans]MEB3967655.1 NEW3 domain-containing protein [Mycobacterium ulcerans]MEB3975906.1 NEW3 domain-containing protein [Mycobacterium ulcerans]MEB4005178.1 NEW3 domain-containing protein [Mycobacterium ulcerans]MEB4414756.1 NEW3 domain-containing protein [Mycobacterium ulcerans]MEB4432909.1 NEW3 domain-containing protein [Mycobacterium ulcerans]